MTGYGIGFQRFLVIGGWRSLAFLVDSSHPAAHAINIPMLVEEGRLALQTIRHATVVCIEKRDIVAACKFESFITCSGLAAVFVMRYDAQARIMIVSSDDLRCVIRGAIIYDQQLEIRECLAQYAFDGLGNIIFAIESRDKYRYAWRWRTSAGIRV